MKIPDVSAFTPREVALFEHVDMAPGPTVWETVEADRRFPVGACIAMGIGFAPVLAVDIRAANIVGLCIMMVAAISFYVRPLVVRDRSDRAREAEMQRGHTTNQRGWGRFPKVDPVTSRVIRLPNEPFLNDAERDQRRRDMPRL